MDVFLNSNWEEVLVNNEVLRLFLDIFPSLSLSLFLLYVLEIINEFESSINNVVYEQGYKI